MKRYWFKPARFWKWFAAYYPSSWQGWIITLVLALAFVAIFHRFDLRAHSVSDALIGFAPWAIALLVLYDLACFRTGEYPPWWRDNHHGS